MSFIDDHYDVLFMEDVAIRESIEQYTKDYHPQKVVHDAIQSFKETAVDEEDGAEILARDILKTISRRKKISVKQKRCLVQMLVMRSEDDYEIDYHSY